MMNSGYQEIEHTADWELKVWAPDLAGLLEQAAAGMAKLAGVRLDDTGPRIERQLDLAAFDAESLLVRFLSELLYLSGQEGLGCQSMRLSLEGLALKAELECRAILSVDKEIKAVTYHQLNIILTGQGLETRIVFDV